MLRTADFDQDRTGQMAGAAGHIDLEAAFRVCRHRAEAERSALYELVGDDPESDAVADLLRARLVGRENFMAQAIRGRQPGAERAARLLRSYVAGRRLGRLLVLSCGRTGVPILLVGEAPAAGRNRPMENASAERVARLAGFARWRGEPRRGVLKAVNVASRPCELSEQPIEVQWALFEAMRRQVESSVSLLLGRTVASLAGLPLDAEPFDWYPSKRRGGVMCYFPHPSGRSRWWSEPANVDRAREFLTDLVRQVVAMRAAVGVTRDTVTADERQRATTNGASRRGEAKTPGRTPRTALSFVDPRVESADMVARIADLHGARTGSQRSDAEVVLPVSRVA